MLVITNPTSPTTLHTIYYRDNPSQVWHLGVDDVPGIVAPSVGLNDYALYMVNGAEVKV